MNKLYLAEDVYGNPLLFTDIDSVFSLGVKGCIAIKAQNKPIEVELVVKGDMLSTTSLYRLIDLLESEHAHDEYFDDSLEVLTKQLENLKVK